VPKFEIDPYAVDDESDNPVMDRFADALLLLDAARNAKAITEQVRKLARLKRDIDAAGRTLASLTSQASGILEAAKAEAAMIRKEALDEVAEDKADREQRAEQAQWQARYDRIASANPSWSQHQILVAMAESGDAGTFRTANIRQGSAGSQFIAGSSLTREMPV
jgi:hypothetical protein